MGAKRWAGGRHVQTASSAGRGTRLIVALVAGFLVTTASPASAQEDIPPGILPEGDWTPDQVDYMFDMVEQAEEALPAFSDNGVRDEELLESLGFVNFGATAGDWDHWMNKEWLDDEHILNPEYPESLVHRWDGEKWVLEAAMFFLRSDDTMEDIPEKYADIAWLPGWHAHPELCWDENLQISGCGQDGEQILIPMMHVWIVDNPCGHRFAGVGVGGINCGGEHDHLPPPPDDPSEVCEDEELLNELAGQLDIDPAVICPDLPDGDEGPGGNEGGGQDKGDGGGPGSGGPGNGDGSHDGGPSHTPGIPAPAVPGTPGFTG